MAVPGPIPGPALTDDGLKSTPSLTTPTGLEPIEPAPQTNILDKTETQASTRSHFVDWDGPDDPQSPMNLSLTRKWLLTISMALLNFVTAFSSSVFSTATRATAKYFHVSNEVMVLGTSLYLIGIIFGPFIFGPLSELYGRKIPLLSGFFIFGIFQIPVAVARNIETVMICRFLQGVFGASAQVIPGGALADVWSPQQRGLSGPAFSAAVFGGPIFAPVVGSFIVQSSLGWRWTQWLTAIMALFFGILALIVVPETFAPVLLRRRAKRLRAETNNQAWRSLYDREVTFKDIVSRYLVRPARMMSLEPILVLITIYMSFVFGVTYLFFEAFPISYAEDRHLRAGISSLPFIGVLIGALISCIVVALTIQTRLAPDPKYGRQQETRLILMGIGGLILTAGLFWFAWTSFPSISPWPQIISGVPIGIGLMLIQIQGFNYLIDCYEIYSSSAVSANTSVRYTFAAAFPLFATGMYHNLGTQWASSLLAFLALAMVPVPALFYVYGERIRRMSRYVPD